MVKSRIIYSILFSASLYFVYFYGGLVPWAIFYTVLGLPLLSYIYLVTTYFSFTYYESCQNKTYIKGEQMEYKCLIVNDIILPFVYMKIFIQTPDTAVSGIPDIKNESLITGKAKALVYGIKCRYRGRYQIGILKVELTDFLNLFKMVYKKNNFLSVLIYPRINISDESTSDGMDMSDFKVSFHNRNKGDECLSNLREYSYGDSGRLIHWKISARMQKLFVTDRESTFDSKVVLALDIYSNCCKPADRIVYEDRLIEDIVSTAHYFLSKNIPVDFVYYSKAIIKWQGTGMADFDELYNILAEIKFTSDSTQQNTLYSVLGDKNTNKTYYIYRTMLSAELYENIIRFHYSEKKIFVRYCYLDNKDAEVYNYHRMLTKQGIKIEHIKEGCNEDGNGTA